MLSKLLSFPSSQPDFFQFDEARLDSFAQKHKTHYYTEPPYPHAVMDDFLPEDVAWELVKRFPKPDAPFWFDRAKHDNQYQQGKLGIGNASRLKGMDPFIMSVLWAFNSYPFLMFLEKLTGIEHLLSDPHYHGGGLHQSMRGGKLKIHADFNFLPELKLYRKMNVLLYLNPDWKDEWGGHLEMWDKDMQNCVRKVAPKFNRCVVFNTTKISYHGHPDPLECPENVSRKSLAFYYYTSTPADEDNEHHSTLWQERPGGES